MPEGDTIHRAADQLQRVIAGYEVLDASDNGRFVDAAWVRGMTVARVQARGNFLLMHFAATPHDSGFTTVRVSAA